MRPSLRPAQLRAGRAKKQRSMVTPEGVALPLTIASRGNRACALMLDFLILLISTVIINIALLYLAGATQLESIQLEEAVTGVSGATEFLLVLIWLIWFIAWNGYFMFFEMGPRGATPGKRLLGMRVASRDGDRLTAEAVVARNLLRDIELFLPLVLILVAPTENYGPAGWAATAWFAVFMLFPFFNKDALRAGDVIAGTWVVIAPKHKLLAVLSTEDTATAGSNTPTGSQYKFGDEELSVYGEYELQTLERILREGQPAAMEAVTETICRKIGWTPGIGDNQAFLEAFYTQLRARLETDMRFGKRKADKFA